MSKKTLLKIIIPLLFSLAIALGFLQRQENISKNEQVKSADIQNELWAFYNQGQDLAKDKQPQKSTATFLAVGDIMLSRNVAGTIKKANDPLLPFSGMKDILKSTDFNFGNLESPFSGRDDFNPTGSLVFNAPKDNIKGLVENKFKILSLANNHAMDQDTVGIAFTIKYLQENGVKGIGTNYNGHDILPMIYEYTWEPGVIEANGIKIAFIAASYSSLNDNGKTKNPFVARIEDTENLKLAIEKAKNLSDFVIVSMHAGTEYKRNPNQSQIDFAHAAIDAGADMVIGAHPHWVQTIERYCARSETILNSPSPILGEGAGGEVNSSCSNPKYIFYSLGNFIFDQEWSQDTKEGLVLKIQISNLKSQNSLQGPRTPAALDQIELIPVIIENYSTPRPATVEETKTILGKIGETNTILK